MKPVVILPQAAEDIEAALDFYDRIDSGAGGYFVDCLLQDLDQLSRVHGFHRVQFGLHRMLAQRFPFGIYYRVQDECVQVFAILDLRMEPSWLREELEHRNG
ncbi:MAG: hypothetical protein U1F81_14715 [Verrucomicrobiaceae bacterium]